MRPCLAQGVKLWPTPTGFSTPHDATYNRPGQNTLGIAARLWQTPKVATGAYSYSRGDKANPFDNLEGQAAKWWPTATTNMVNGAGAQGRRGGKNLQTAVALWATPSSRDWKDTEGMSAEGVNPDGTIRSRLDQLGRQVLLTPSNGPLSSPVGPTSPRRLNVQFVNWMMGYAPKWTSFEPTATPSVQSKEPTP